MRDFRTFVYLDVQKTGSAFINDLLTRFSNAEEISYDKHGPITTAAASGRPFYFISCRDPLDQYLSLYSFGCGRRGQLGLRLHRAGLTALYDGTADGFERWVNLLLKPTNADFLGEYYLQSGVAPLIGFQTFRLLRLSVANPVRALAGCRSHEDILALYDHANLAQFCVRFETIRESLVELIEGPLSYAINDVPAAVEYVRTAQALNKSKRIDEGEDFIVTAGAKSAIETREWFFFERMGYRRYSTVSVP